MSLVDGLVAFAVIGAFAWVIFAKLVQKNPKIKDWVSNVNKKVEPPKTNPIEDFRQQIHPEKHTMM